MPVGAPELVPRERVEVGAERRHVDREVRRRLGAVEEHPGPRRLGALDDLRDRVDRAEHVRDVGERHEPRPPREEALERLEVERPLVGHGHVPEAELPLAGEEDPRHQVRVVLHLGQEDLVPLDERPPRPGVDDEVDRLRRPLGEDDLLALPRPEERPHPVPGALVELGRLLPQRVDRAVDVGVRPLVEERARRRGPAAASGRSPPSRGRRAGGPRSCGRGSGSRRGPGRRGSPALSRDTRRARAGRRRVRPRAAAMRSAPAPSAPRSTASGRETHGKPGRPDRRLERREQRVALEPGARRSPSGPPPSRPGDRRRPSRSRRRPPGSGRSPPRGPAPKRSSTRRRSPQSGLTSSWTASAPGSSPKWRGCRKRSRITPP